MNNIINLFKEFNLTESETKVYTALLKNGPTTGYEVSKLSGVPRSKVYNVLELLITKGCSVCSKNTNPVYYSAVPVEELVRNFKISFDQKLKEMEYELRSFNSKINLDYIWHIQGYDNIFNKCRNIIRQTKSELFLQIWREDLDQIYDEIKALEKANIKTLVILYSLDHTYDVDLANCYNHGFEKEKLTELGGRWISLISDSREVVLGSICNSQNAEVVWTASVPLVFMAKEYVKHDAYCLKAINLFPNIQHVFGEDVSKIRDVF